MPLARAWCSVCYFENTYRPSEIREEEASDFIDAASEFWATKKKKKNLIPHTKGEEKSWHIP